MDPLWRLAWEERPRLLAVARHRSLNRADADEVVAEAILRCVTHPGVDPVRLPRMLTAVTLRLCVDALRERTTAERNAPRLLVRPPDDTEAVLDRAEYVWLAAEMASLTDKERAALTARMLGLTVAETAEALGGTYKAAESALDRAKRKMRTLWARTLALLPLRRRRAAVVVTVAVAATTTLGVWRPWQDEPGPVRMPVVEQAQVARTGGDGAHAPLQHAASTRTRAPHQAPPSSVTPARLTTPDLRLGPLRQEPVVVALDLRDVPSRVQECVRNGVKIVVSEAMLGVVCREGTGG